MSVETLTDLVTVCAQHCFFQSDNVCAEPRLSIHDSPPRTQLISSKLLALRMPKVSSGNRLILKALGLETAYCDSVWLKKVAIDFCAFGRDEPYKRD